MSDILRSSYTSDVHGVFIFIAERSVVDFNESNNSLLVECIVASIAKTEGLDYKSVTEIFVRNGNDVPVFSSGGFVKEAVGDDAFIIWYRIDSDVDSEWKNCFAVFYDGGCRVFHNAEFVKGINEEHLLN